MILHVLEREADGGLDLVPELACRRARVRLDADQVDHVPPALSLEHARPDLPAGAARGERRWRLGRNLGDVEFIEEVRACPLETRGVGGKPRGAAAYARDAPEHVSYEYVRLTRSPK